MSGERRGGGGGYAIVVVETAERKLKLFGCPSGSYEEETEADEIWEVNGRHVENWLLPDISDFLQRCIHSRTICLRIKPKKCQEKVGDVTVRDTFLISVGSGQPPQEEDPPPPDMTQSSGSSLQTSTPDPQKQLQQTSKNSAPPLKNGVQSRKNANRKKSAAEIVIEKEVCDIQKILSFTQPTKTSPPPSAEDAMKDPKLQACVTLVNNNNNNTMSSLVQTAPRHREMAVDVPDTFVAVTKTTPRYPPPRKKPPSTPDTSSLKKNGLYRFSAGGSSGRGGGVHVRSMSSQDGNTTASPDEERRTPPTPRISELVRDSNPAPETEEKLMDLGQLHRIKKYRDSLRKRKEEDDRQSKEDEFLRSSLRGSKKLRSLRRDSSCAMKNSGFRLDEGDTPSEDGGKTLVAPVPDGEPKELTRLYEPSALVDLLHNVEDFLLKSGFEEGGSCLGDLDKLLHNTEFRTLLRLHNRLQELCCFRCLPTPESAGARLLALEVSRSLHDVPSKDARELLCILGTHPFGGLLSCHDQVAASQATPDISEEEELLARLSQYAEDSIKIVRIEKTTEPLGATVKNDGEAVIVGRLIKGGIAEKSGLLHEGDEILEVNGLELRGKSVNDVCDIMAAMSGTLTFLIVPTQFDTPKQPTIELVTHLKAHFDYEPEDDLYLPCRELGMSFQKGDVLHIINQNDPNWWQAFREGEEDQLLAGLIPSRSFQQQREMMKQAVVGDIREKKSKKGKFLCAKRHHRRKKKKMYNVNYGEDADGEQQALTYEEVRLYYPRAHHKRPLVLIGPQKVGRHELRQKLMEDTNRFAAAVPHTSRTKKDSEVNGVDYFFISRAEFEADISSGRFVEHGEYQKSYYGTSLGAIRSVIDSGKTCVLNLHPQSLRILKKSDLMPYIVFIAPPSMEKLRLHCLKTEQAVKDDELRDIIERAREMEELHGHHFDLVLVNVDLEKTLSELLHEMSVIEREPQWVPATWIGEDAT